MINFNVSPFVGKETDYMKEAISNGKICGDGEFTKKCNWWFENQTGAKKLFSQRHALMLWRWLQFLVTYNPAMTSYTFVSTADAYVVRGSKIVFVDIRPDTMNIDESLIEYAITPKTNAKRSILAVYAP